MRYNVLRLCDGGEKKAKNIQFKTYLPNTKPTLNLLLVPHYLKTAVSSCCSYLFRISFPNIILFSIFGKKYFIMTKLVILPTVDKNTQPTYHLKSEYPQINFSEFNEKRDYDFEEKNSSENYSQITIITSYTVSVDSSEHFCRFDIQTPMEVNIHGKDFTKENFLQALGYHVNNSKEYFTDKILTFPNGFELPLAYEDLDVNLIADIFLSKYDIVS